MAALRRAGHTLIVHTNRATGKDRGAHVAEWLRYFEIPFDEVTGTKPRADVFIDDRAIRFEDWPKTLQALL